MSYTPQNLVHFLFAQPTRKLIEQKEKSETENQKHFLFNGKINRSINKSVGILYINHLISFLIFSSQNKVQNEWERNNTTEKKIISKSVIGRDGRCL